MPPSGAVNQRATQEKTQLTLTLIQIKFIIPTDPFPNGGGGYGAQLKKKHVEIAPSLLRPPIFISDVNYVWTVAGIKRTLVETDAVSEREETSKAETFFLATEEFKLEL